MPAQSIQSCQLCDPKECNPSRFLCPRNFPGNDTGVGCHFLLQGLFPGIKPVCPMSTTLEGGFFTTEPSGKPKQLYISSLISLSLFSLYLSFFLLLFHSYPVTLEENGAHSLLKNLCIVSYRPIS